MCVGQGDCIRDNTRPRVPEGEWHNIARGSSEGGTQYISELGKGCLCRWGHRLWVGFGYHYWPSHHWKLYHSRFYQGRGQATYPLWHVLTFKFQWLWNIILLNTVFVLASFCWMMNNNYFLYPIPIFNFCCINTFGSFPFGVLYANNCSKFYLYNGVISPIITPNNTRNNCSTDNCKFISHQPPQKKKILS